MTISFANSPIVQSFTETEALTRDSWSDLIERANRAKVPYYSVVVCTLKGGRDQVYDAVHFDRYLKQSEAIDPLTRLPIEKISYQFLKTPVDLTKKKHHFVVLILPDNFEQKNIAFEANNFHACENENQKRRAANCQLIYGVFLLKQAKAPKEYREACRWLNCAAANGSSQAESLLKVRSDYMRATRHTRHLKENKNSTIHCRVF